MPLAFFYTAAPGAYIHTVTGCTIPPDQGAAGRLHKWRVQLALAGDVAQHLSQATDAVGDRHTEGICEGFKCHPLEEFQEDLSGAAFCCGTRFGFGTDHSQKLCPQPTLARFTTGWCTRGHWGCGWWRVVASLQLQLAQGSRGELAVRW